MTPASDSLRWNAIDRPLGWLIALGGCILILDQTVFYLNRWADFATWWNVGASLVVVSIVLLAVTGLLLPRPVLSVLWRAIPLGYITLQATWILGYSGDDIASGLPWLWTVEAAVITLLLLSFRPAVAVATGLAFSLTPAVVSLLMLGYLPETIRLHTPNQLGNVVYLAIFVGVRLQLERLHIGEREAQRQHQRQVKAAALLEQHAVLTRIVHDEVLAALSAAIHAPSAGSEPLRRDASNAIVVLTISSQPEIGAETQRSSEETLTEFVEHLHRIDSDFILETDLEPGTYPERVVREITLATGEALRNSVKHAGSTASRRIQITFREDSIRVSIGDDGVGFLPDPSSPRLGVKRSILDRMTDLGGSALIDSVPGCGTEVILTWPT